MDAGNSGEGGNESGSSQTSSPKRKKTDLFLAGLRDRVTVKIAVTGKSSLSKKSFINACVGFQYRQESCEIEEIQRVSIGILSKSGGTANVVFLNIPDAEYLDTIRLEAYKDVDGFLVLFDLNDASTFAHLQQQVFAEIMKAKKIDPTRCAMNVPVIIGGYQPLNEQSRQVEDDSIMKTIQTYNCNYHMINDTTSDTISKCFQQFLTTVVDFKLSLSSQYSRQRTKHKCYLQ